MSETKAQIIAVAADDANGLNGQVGQHFGRCPAFVIVKTENEKIVSSQVAQNPGFINHTPGVVPQFIGSLGANVIIAGGMGPRAVDMFHSFGVDVATGVGGKVENVVLAYLKGEISGIIPCSHDHPESCGAH